MVGRSEDEYLESLRAHAAGTLRYFSSGLKPERERAVCRAFLRCVGIAFADNEIVAPSTEPLDVSFRDARFQVREVMEKGRRRGDEWKLKQARWHRARSIDDIIEASLSSNPMQSSELIEMVTQALEGKSKKYGKSQCANIDALVYVNLTATRFLDPMTVRGDASGLEGQGWRSVSILFPPYGLVMSAGAGAPSFLELLIGRVLNEWQSPDELFEL